MIAAIAPAPAKAGLEDWWPRRAGDAAQRLREIASAKLASRDALPLRCSCRSALRYSP